MSTGSIITMSSEQNTVQYATPINAIPSTNTSIDSERSNNGHRSAHFPKVSIQVPHVSASRAFAPPTSVPYAVPFARPAQYSAVKIQFEHMKHRCKVLDAENQRLMQMQNDLITDANRRLEMHVNEIRMLKEDKKKLSDSNKELRDLCCFLDDERQKTRRLAREWQKFAKYTSQIMRQEIRTYQQKLQELEFLKCKTVRENDELKQLCLYLDEQRQSLLINSQMDETSEDLGCGSSERSDDSYELKQGERLQSNQHQENAIRKISEQMRTVMTSSDDLKVENVEHTEQLTSYIQSLESRIRLLETNNTSDPVWNFGSNLTSECDEKTIIDRCSDKISIITQRDMESKMVVSTTSTMTSSGTTYGSSETDGECAVFVMGNDIDNIRGQDARILPRIEEDDDEKSENGDGIEESVQLPPCISPLSSNLLTDDCLSWSNLGISSESDRPLLSQRSTPTSSTSIEVLFAVTNRAVSRSPSVDRKFNGVRVAQVNETLDIKDPVRNCQMIFREVYQNHT